MKCSNCDGSGKVPHEWTEEEYEEYLNECFGDVDICGMKYPSGYALRQLDEIAFNCGMSEQEGEDDCEECAGTGEVKQEEEAITEVKP
jgi:DnaJ-class molecular chaperone